MPVQAICVCVCVSLIGEHTVHPIAMKLSKVVNMLTVVVEIKKKLYQLGYSVLPYRSKNQCLCVPYRNTHRSSDWNETFTSSFERVRAGFGNLKKLKFVLAGVSGVALSLQEHTPFILLATQINCRGAAVEVLKQVPSRFPIRDNVKIILLYIYYLTFICKTTLLP